MPANFAANHASPNATRKKTAAAWARKRPRRATRGKQKRQPGAARAQNGARRAARIQTEAAARAQKGPRRAARRKQKRWPGPTRAPGAPHEEKEAAARAHKGPRRAARREKSDRESPQGLQVRRAKEKRAATTRTLPHAPRKTPMRPSGPSRARRPPGGKTGIALKREGKWADVKVKGARGVDREGEREKWRTAAKRGRERRGEEERGEQKRGDGATREGARGAPLFLVYGAFA